MNKNIVTILFIVTFLTCMGEPRGNYSENLKIIGVGVPEDGNVSAYDSHNFRIDSSEENLNPLCGSYHYL